jgi:Lon protease-like protein
VAIGVINGYGTIMHVLSIQLLPDNRCVVEAEGVARFRVMESAVRDGYVMARIRRYVLLKFGIPGVS